MQKCADIRVVLSIFVFQMVEVEINKQQRQVREVDVLRGREVIKRHTGRKGSLCFVVRRPGESTTLPACVFCR